MEQSIEVLFIAAYQVSLFLFLVLSINYFFRGKDFKLKIGNPLVKIGLLVYASLWIGSIFFFNLSSMLLFLIIVFGIALISLGFFWATSFLFLSVVPQIIFYQEYYLIILYISSLIVDYLLLRLCKNLITKYAVIYLVALVSFNIELYYNDSPVSLYIVANMICISTWYLMIVNILFLKNRNTEFLDYKNNLYLDKATNAKNYNCLLKDSRNFLVDRDSDLAIILINVDNLKDVNILHGNSFGDRVIKIVAGSIEEIVSMYGTLYRLHGDTFCVILKNEKQQTLKIMTEKISLDVDIRDLIIDNNKINISVSIGAYYGKTFSKNIDDYIELAHESLLISKTNSNKIHIISK